MYANDCFDNTEMHAVVALDCSIWVRSMHHYYQATQEIKPMREALVAMRADLEVLMKGLI